MNKKYWQDKARALSLLANLELANDACDFGKVEQYLKEAYQCIDEMRKASS